MPAFFSHRCSKVLSICTRSPSSRRDYVYVTRRRILLRRRGAPVSDEAYEKILLPNFTRERGCAPFRNEKYARYTYTGPAREAGCLSSNLALKGHRYRKGEGEGGVTLALTPMGRTAFRKYMAGPNYASDQMTKKKRDGDDANGHTCHGIRETAKQVKRVHLSSFHDLTLVLP